MSSEQPKEDELKVTEGSVTGSTYTPLTDAQVDTLAKEFYRNEIFFSFQIPENQRGSMIMSVFMVLIFLDDIARKQMVENEIDVFYEYYKEAGPTSVNGYPTFFSCRMMTRSDANKVIARYKEIRELLGDNNG